MTIERALEVIAAAIDRCDRRTHAAPALLELSRVRGAWCAQLLADPMPVSLAVRRPTAERAVVALAESCEHYNWRRLRL